MEEGKDPTRAPAKGMVEGTKVCSCRGEALIWARDTKMSAPHSCALKSSRRAFISAASRSQATGQPEVSPPALSGPQRPRISMQEHTPRCFHPQTPGRWFSLERQGSVIYLSPSTAGFGSHHLLSGQGRGLMTGAKKDKVPSMVPHLVFLPRILLPLTWYS